VKIRELMLMPLEYRDAILKRTGRMGCCRQSTTGGWIDERWLQTVDTTR
jgi:hypothetical protein